MNADWSIQEIEFILTDYFIMLKEEIEGRSFNKTHHRKNLLPLLNNRKSQAIEFKHRNISAVLAKLGIPYIKGYIPAWKYQKLLEERVSTYLTQHLYLENTFKIFAELPIKESPSPLPYSFESILSSPPERKPKAEEPELTYRNPVKINYLEIEQANRSVGMSGEKLVLEYERWRLIKEGKESFADKIEWVAQTKGDGLGYDILSRNKNGTDRYIEVKSTKLTKDAPIFFSRNEYEFSLDNSSQYHLYRVFNLNQDPKLFIVDGRFDDFCDFKAVKYKGYF